MLTVGDLLRNGRTQRELSVADVEKKTKIRSKYITAIEANDWSIFPSKVYITGIIRSYSKFLDIDPDKTLAYFRRDYEKREDVKFKGKVPSLHVLPETRKIVLAGVIFISILFLAYFAYQVNLYLSPPDIAIVEPTKNVFRNTERLLIVGQTEKDSTVKIFNDTVYPDKEGRFEYVVPLKKGRNTVKVEVTGANGRKNYLLEEYILE